ncbi:MAG: RelE/StbE family addiction module toxin, partial [Halanaerobium sp.]
MDKIDENISQLKDFPYKGKKPDDENLNSKGYQILVIGSYLVFYVIFQREKIVEIKRIIRGFPNSGDFLILLSVLLSLGLTLPSKLSI